MKFHLSRKQAFCAALAVLLSFSLAAPVLVRAVSVPQRETVKSGVTVHKNTKASVDASNLELGFIGVSYTGGKNVRIKVQITKSGGVTYTYNLNNAGTAETFPLTDGNGDYSVKIFENTSGTRYAQAYACTLKLQLTSEFSPFLYSNQFVNFTDKSKTAEKAAELVKGKSTDLARVTEIFHYAVNHISYDYQLAETVASGYLPDVDKVLESGKGICFDYAAVMAAMLRSQNIPCKLVVGYAGKVYHAWINVYIEGVGWVDHLIYFDGKNWSLMDPTFVSSGKNNPAVLKYVGDGTNYTQKYAY